MGLCKGDIGVMKGFYWSYVVVTSGLYRDYAGVMYIGVI